MELLFRDDNFFSGAETVRVIERTQKKPSRLMFMGERHKSKELELRR
jgi:hypothetical protein